MNKDNKHTPGPWSVSPHPNGFNIEVIAHDGIVARALGTSGTKEETKANAALIAASPDLKSALIAMLSQWRERTSEDTNACRLAESALSKTKGEA